MFVGFNYLAAQEDSTSTTNENANKEENVEENSTNDVANPVTSEKPTSPATATSPVNTSNQEDEEEETASNEEGGNENLGPVFDGMYIFASGGWSVYYGDLAEYHFFPYLNEFGQKSDGAYRLGFGRDIIYGIGAEFYFQKGTLSGSRKPGKNSTWVSFENKFYDMAISAKYYNLTNTVFGKNEYRRWYVYGQIGIGMMWYRSQLYDTETLNTKDYEGYTPTENTESLAQQTLLDKTKRSKSLTVPYALTFGYRINYKTDLNLIISQTNTFTDRLDAWNRSWTAKDKYNYIGIGITYNFNRDKEKDAIKKRPKKEKDSDNATDETTSATPKSDGLLSRLFGGKRKNSKEDELLNIRLKLFETQLKLFEMQYLLEN
ncbi:MAG: hypothetical protein Kow0079_13250 [Vicingaceae bacterium]